MKKLLSIFIALMFLVNTTLAYTVKITVKGVDLVVTGEVGNTIEIEKKLPEIVGWNVKSGNIEIINNTFVMPGGRTGEIYVNNRNTDCNKIGRKIRRSKCNSINGTRDAI